MLQKKNQIYNFLFEFINYSLIYQESEINQSIELLVFHDLMVDGYLLNFNNSLLLQNYLPFLYQKREYQLIMQQIMLLLKFQFTKKKTKRN